MIEQTLVLVKPDAVRRGLIGEIVGRFEAKGFDIVAMKMLKFDRKLTEGHYGQYAKEPFYAKLSKFIQSGPCVAMVVEGNDAIAVVRMMMGATSHLDAAPGTIRGDFADEVTANLVHGSDSRKTARAEIKRFFSTREIFSGCRKRE